MLKYTIEYPNGEQKRCLKDISAIRPDTPYIASVPMHIPDLKEATHQFSDKEIESTVKPEPLGLENKNSWTCTTGRFTFYT